MATYAVAFMLLVSFSFLPASVVPYLINERTKNEKQVQIVAGVTPLTYWTTAFVWDLMV